MGLTFDTPGRRIAKLEEVVALVKAHCAGDELACAGEFVNVNGYQGTPQTGAASPPADHDRRRAASGC